MRLSDWPSLRLVIPLIAGILISDTISNTRAQVPVWCALDILALLTVIILIFCDSRPRVSGFCLSLSFVLAGALSYTLQMERVRMEWPSDRRLYHGVVDSWPLERERSYRLEITLTDSLYRGRGIYLYLPRDSATSSLEPGSPVAFNGIINKPTSDGAGFDYESWLLRHGISGTLWVPSGDWQRGTSKMKPGLKARCARLRRAIIQKYMEWGLGGDALAVVSAVTLGEKKQLSEGLKEVYSSSGVSHVLAVSGLHVGIMCWILYLLFPSFLFRPWVRELMVMAIMWSYAFSIGMPVSITRSLIMFSVIAVCRALGRESSALNSLGVAAFFMLVANPSALFDMSFQLSFSAVLFIVMLTPSLSGLYEPVTIPGRYLWRLSVVSVSAQTGTAPLVMYHFSSFSTYSLLSNLFVVPVMFVVVALSMSLCITGWIPPLRNLTVNTLTLMIDSMTGLLTRISSLPFSSLELSIGSGTGLLAIYAVIIFAFLWLKEKHTGHLVYALACIAFASVFALFQNLVV